MYKNRRSKSIPQIISGFDVFDRDFCCGDWSARGSELWNELTDVQRRFFDKVAELTREQVERARGGGGPVVVGKVVPTAVVFPEEEEQVGTGTGWLILYRTGFGPVSDRFQTSVMSDTQSMSQCPCHHVMSDAQSCRMHRSVMSDAQCHVGCTALTEIHESNLKVVRCW